MQFYIFRALFEMTVEFVEYLKFARSETSIDVADA